MPVEDIFREDELKLIEVAKKTLKILAKIIKDRDPGEVIKDVVTVSEIKDAGVAKVIDDTNFLQKIKDFNPDSESASNDLDILADVLTIEMRNTNKDRKLGEQEIKDAINGLSRTIRKKLTPDIPGLNRKDEAAIIGRLGPSIFVYLMKGQKRQ